MAKLNVPNRTIFHGDNLEMLRSINSDSIDLITIDPPFKKDYDFVGKLGTASEGASFQDHWKWDRDVDQKWVDEIKDEHPALMEVIESAFHAHSEAMGAYLCFLSVRLMSMHRVLKPTGSIFVHCDHSAGHYIKSAMDTIFGSKHFVNEIVWCYDGSGRGRKTFSKKHDTIFWYAKKKFIYNLIKVPITSEAGIARFNKIDEEGNRYQISGRGYKYYLKDGKNANDWWTDISALGSKSNERVGYPTQKPIALVQRIVLAASKPGDVVLDAFIGSGTAAKACEGLDEPRRWIGIDLWLEEAQAIKDRLAEITSHIKDGGKIIYRTHPAQRTDDGRVACPMLGTKTIRKEPPGPKMTRAEMKAQLINEAGGNKCAGCDRIFDDPDYLELDHNTPRSSGGINHISNRILLCSPCNRRKSNTLTLIGLRQRNRKLGKMAVAGLV